jgi:hypothetical protein
MPTEFYRGEFLPPATRNPVTVRVVHPVVEGEPIETPERGPLSRYSLALEHAPTDPPSPSLPEDFSIMGLAKWILEGSVPDRIIPVSSQAALRTLMKEIQARLIERDGLLRDIYNNLEKGELR